MVVLNLGIGIHIFYSLVFVQILTENCAVLFCNYVYMHVSNVLCAALVRPEVLVKQMYFISSVISLMTF